MELIYFVAIAAAVIVVFAPLIYNGLRSCRGVRDVIDVVSPKIGCFLNLKRNLQKLDFRIGGSSMYVRMLEVGYVHVSEPEWVTQRRMALLQEGTLLSEEAAQAINHWTPSCYRLSIRVAELTKEISDISLGGGGRFTRDRIASIDVVASNVWCLARFNANVNKLTIRMQQINLHLINAADPSQVSNINQQKFQWQCLRGAHLEGMRLIDEADHMNGSWYTRLSVSCFKLSRRIERTTSHIDRLLADLR